MGYFSLGDMLGNLGSVPQPIADSRGTWSRLSDNFDFEIICVEIQLVICDFHQIVICRHTSLEDLEIDEADGSITVSK